MIRSQFQAAAAELTAEQGTSDPADWRADATAERISFVPGLLPYHHALHEPPERDPAGDLLRRASLSPRAVTGFAGPRPGTSRGKDEWRARFSAALWSGASSDPEVQLLGSLRLSLWLCAVWAIVLYVFFVTLATISPAEVAGLTVVMAILAVLVTVRSLRLASELADRGGDPRIRRALNKQRERRGF